MCVISPGTPYVTGETARHPCRTGWVGGVLLPLPGIPVFLDPSVETQHERGSAAKGKRNFRNGYGAGLADLALHLLQCLTSAERPSGQVLALCSLRGIGARGGDVAGYGSSCWSLSTQEAEAWLPQAQDQLRLHSEYQVSQNYIARPCLGKQKSRVVAKTCKLST